MIEVEQRSFISEEKYNELINYFKENGVVFGETKQISNYFKGDLDFRIMAADNYTKMWLKKGKMHDDAREEIEVFIDNDYRDNLFKLFANLGYEIEIKWFRKRLMGVYQDITVTIDYTIGYGYIIELEKIVEDRSMVEETKAYLLKTFENLGVNVSSREEFEEKYEDYRINWKKYTKGITDEKFLSE
jgi:adenylate cyclase class IV